MPCGTMQGQGLEVEGGCKHHHPIHAKQRKGYVMLAAVVLQECHHNSKDLCAAWVQLDVSCYSAPLVQLADAQHPLQ